MTVAFWVVGVHNTYQLEGHGGDWIALEVEIVCILQQRLQ
jgi:hypothetical protein